MLIIKLGRLKAATQTNIVVLTLLIKKAFNYCLLTHPVGAMFGGVELDKVYSQLLLNKLGVELALVLP